MLMHYKGALRCTCWLLCGTERPQLITGEIASFWTLLVCNFCWKGGIITSCTAWAIFVGLFQEGAWIGVEDERNRRALSSEGGGREVTKFLSVSWIKRKELQTTDYETWHIIIQHILHFAFRWGVQACAHVCMWLGVWGLCWRMVPSHVCSYVGFLTPGLVADGTVSEGSTQQAHWHKLWATWAR